MDSVGEWRADTAAAPGGTRYRLLQREEPMSLFGLFENLEDSADFASWYSRLLQDSSFDAFFWEHPPLSRRTGSLPGEFVLIEAPQLSALAPDSAAFADHFARQEDDPAVFCNIGGDALLLAPQPRAAAAAYIHLARFVRTAPAAQVRNLWRRTGRLARERGDRDEPIWISTSGLGVSWLHVRIDRQPKYYQFAEYRRPDWPGQRQQ